MNVNPGGGSATPQPRVGWYKSGQALPTTAPKTKPAAVANQVAALAPKTRQVATPEAATGFKYGRVDRSKRKRK